MSSFAVVLQQVTIYYGIPVLVAGILGGVLNTIVFLSLQTFRRSSCAFYFTVMSIVDVGQLLTGLLTRIMISGYFIDWTQMSPFYCKLRFFLLELCSLTSSTCICLATIDQYLATCSNPRWRKWSSLKVAYRLTVAMVIFWALHGIPFLVFYGHAYVPSTDKPTCAITHAIFAKYNAFVYSFTLIGFLPIFIEILFALMAFRNVRQLPHLTVPLVRRELEKQLTIMVLVQVALNVFLLLPNSITNVLQTSPVLMSNPDIAARIQFAFSISILVYFLNFASPFYIYVCVSERFRRQLIYVLYKMHFNRCRQRIMINNEVVPA